MSWAQRLKRVFNIGISQCESCTKHKVKTVACITDPIVFKKILNHLNKIASPITAPLLSLLPPIRAPPDNAPFSDYIIQRDFDFGA